MSYITKKLGGVWYVVDNKTNASIDGKSYPSRDHAEQKVRDLYDNPLPSKDKPMVGTNCATCEYSKRGEVKDVTPDQLNKQGGTIPNGAEEMARAKKADLVTMPGKAFPIQVKMCTHDEVKQFVNERMCCAFWDAPGTFRAYGKQAIGK